MNKSAPHSVSISHWLPAALQGHIVELPAVFAPVRVQARSHKKDAPAPALVSKVSADGSVTLQFFGYREPVEVDAEEMSFATITVAIPGDYYPLRELRPATILPAWGTIPSEPFQFP